MTTIYFKNRDGRRVAVEVTDEVAAADKETRRAAWRNETKERYYRDQELHDLNDHDEELACEQSDPEVIHIAVEEQAERRTALLAALNELTSEQIELVKMLKSGMGVTEIAAQLGVDKSAISHRRKRIQEKIKKFLK